MSDGLLNVDDFVTIPRHDMVEGARARLAVSPDSRSKIQRMTDRLVRALDDLDVTSFFNAAPATDARVLLSILRSDPLTPTELRNVLDALRRRGRLGELLHVIREDEFRDYLRAMKVPWDYIVMNWAPSAGDSLQVLSGFIVGVGKDSAEIVVLLATLIGATFDEELAEDAAAFWDGIKKLFAMIEEKGIGQVAEEQYDRMIRAFDDAIYERRFFDAGQMLGQFVAFVVPLLAALPGAARAGVGLASALARLVDDLIEVSLELIRRFNIELQNLYRAFEGALGPQFALAGGTFQGELVAGGQWIVFSQGGEAVGKIGRDTFMAQVRARRGTGGGGGGRAATNPRRPLDDLTPDELEEFFRDWTASSRLTRSFGKRFAEELEGLVNDAIVSVYVELKRTGEKLNPGLYGKRLHERFRQLAEAFYEDLPFSVRPERRLVDFAEIPESIKNMKVRDFLKGRTEGLSKEFLSGKVGDKIPDLVLISDDTIFVWDLTTKANPAHQAKTWFYREVFRRGTKKKVEVGESYYRYYRPNAWGK